MWLAPLYAINSEAVYSPTVCPTRGREGTPFIQAAPRSNSLLLEPERTNTIPMHSLWTDESGQDIAEYAVMLAVILVLVIGTIRLVGTNANTAFSTAASSIQ
jgi:Flp pilus assembly pilin Flp